MTNWSFEKEARTVGQWLRKEAMMTAPKQECRDASYIVYIRSSYWGLHFWAIDVETHFQSFPSNHLSFHSPVYSSRPGRYYCPLPFLLKFPFSLKQSHDWACPLQDQTTSSLIKKNNFMGSKNLSCTVHCKPSASTAASVHTLSGKERFCA